MKLATAIVNVIMRRIAGKDGEVDRIAMKWNLTKQMAERRLDRELHGQVQTGEK